MLTYKHLYLTKIEYILIFKRWTKASKRKTEHHCCLSLQFRNW